MKRQNRRRRRGRRKTDDTNCVKVGAEPAEPISSTAASSSGVHGELVRLPFHHFTVVSSIVCRLCRLHYNIMNTLDTDINLNQQFLGAKDTPTEKRQIGRMNGARWKGASGKKNGSWYEMCVGRIAKCHGLFRCFVWLGRHASSSRQHHRASPPPPSSLSLSSSLSLPWNKKKEFVRHFRVKKFTAGMALGGAGI